MYIVVKSTKKGVPFGTILKVKVIDDAGGVIAAAPNQDVHFKVGEYEQFSQDDIIHYLNRFMSTLLSVQDNFLTEIEKLNDKVDALKKENQLDLYIIQKKINKM